MFHELLYSRCLSVGSNTFRCFTCTAQVSVPTATKFDYGAYYCRFHLTTIHAKAMGLRGSVLGAFAAFAAFAVFAAAVQVSDVGLHGRGLVRVRSKQAVFRRCWW